MRISDWSSDVCSSDLPVCSMQRAALDPRYVADRVSQSLVKERTTFSNCRIDRSSFIRARMQEVVMLNCHITATAFHDANMTEARIDGTCINGDDISRCAGIVDIKRARLPVQPPAQNRRTPVPSPP